MESEIEMLLEDIRNHIERKMKAMVQMKNNATFKPAVMQPIVSDTVNQEPRN